MEKDFQKGGIDYLESLSKTMIDNFYKKVNNDYYNKGNSKLSDSQYDILVDYISEKYPELIKIGAPIERTKTNLPFFMGSMNKLKMEDSSFSRWISKFKGPYIISTKIDGVSGLLDTRENKKKLYTRGNGIEGQDISFFIPYLDLPDISNMVIRGEFVISKEKNIPHSRNIVTGILSSKYIMKEKIKTIDFIPYEIIHPILKPSEQFDRLKELFPKNVFYEKLEKIQPTILSSFLEDWRNSFPYEIDGIIVTNNEIYERKNENPSHSFAFKNLCSENIVETKVLDVLWKQSKDGFLKPRIRVEPVKIRGQRIEYTTGFNARFIQKHKIGLGTILQLTLGGDVIPHILKIENGTEAKFPDIEYKWNTTKTEILTCSQNKERIMEEIFYFFRGLQIDCLGPKTLEKIFEQGFQTIPDIVHIKESELLEIDGIQKKNAQKILNGIQEKIEKISISKLLSFSNRFGRGFGEKKLELIFQHFPLWYKDKISIDDFSNIKGLTKETGILFISNIENAKQFLIDLKKDVSFQEKEQKKKKKVIFSGFRDKILEDILEKHNFQILDHLSKDIHYVIIEDDKIETTKIKKAKKWNLNLVKKEEILLNLKNFL